MRDRLAATLVACASAIPFLPALANGFVQWDDAESLVRNPFVRGLSSENVVWMLTTFHKGPYQPLSWLSFGIEHEIHGLDPRWCHLTNVLFHAASVALVFYLARGVARLRGHSGAGPSLLGAVAAALVFGAHPLRVESVAWATERRDVLSGFFFLGAALYWLSFVEGGRRSDRVLAVLAFVLSLLAKGTGLMLPVALLTLDHLLLARGSLGAKRLVAEKIPLFAASAAAGVLAIVGQRKVGAMTGLEDHGVIERLVQCGYGLAFYAGATVFPFRLSPLHEMPRGDITADPAVLFGAIAAVLGLSIAIASRRRVPAVLAAILAFAILVSPVLGAAQSGYQIVAERYSYLPSIPLSILAGLALASLASRAGRAPVLAALALIAGSFGALSFQATRLWKSDLRLWTRALSVDPENAIARYNRGLARRVAGDTAGAIDDYSEAIRFRPSWPDPWYNRGNARLAGDDFEGAIADYSEVIRIGTGSVAKAYGNRATARTRLGDGEGALEDLERALSLAPNDPDLRRNAEILREALRR